MAVIQTGGSKAGRGRREKVNHGDLEDLKGASAFASSASGGDLLEVFGVFVVRFYCQWLNRRRHGMAVAEGDCL
jgi:hypothetical protein